MEEAYKDVIWTLPDDFLSFDRFMASVRRLDMKSSPGWPYMRESITNGQFLGWNGYSFDPLRLERLWFDVRTYLENPGEIILYCFVKREPHKISKVLDNRWRLIMASPIHVQVVWTMLFGYQNDLEIQKCYHIPSQQGIILPGGGWKMFLEQWKSRGYDTGLDKSAWDWTFPYWLIELDLDFRRRMGRGASMGAWWKIASRLYDEMFVNPYVLLSNGILYQQRVPGVMKSGCVNTISTNSHAQVMVHVLACISEAVSIYPLPVCCGDDTLQRKSQAINLKAYERFGAIVKSASEGMEFVGHEFISCGPVPLYLGKHLVKSFHVDDENLEDYFDSLCRMYCKSDLFEFWARYAMKVGVNVYSREYYNYWYDNEDVF